MVAGSVRYCGNCAITRSIDRTTNGILCADGLCFSGASPPVGPYTRHGVKLDPLVWKETKSSGSSFSAVKARKSWRNSVPPPRDGGPAYLRGGQHAAHTLDRDPVQLVELLRRAAPVEDVRLVPQLPQPGVHLLLAVPLQAVRGERRDQVAPAVKVAGRVRPLPGLIGGVDGGARGHGELRR